MSKPTTTSTWVPAAPQIAILGDSMAVWTGGIDFLCFCVNALDSVSPETTWRILLPSNSIPKLLALWAKNVIKKLIGWKINPRARILRSELIEALTSYRLRIEIVDYYDSASGLASAVRRCGGEAVFPCSVSLGRSFPLSWIGYIPDLQHKRLPHWFSEKECKARDKAYSRILDEAQVVIVNANAVVRDIEEFYPDHRARIFALPFCPPANRARPSEPSRSKVRAEYHLPARFFVVSNQFWIHKSHETAFLALRIVRDAGHDVHLVCTGKPDDYRWPEHFMNLMGILEKNNLRDSIHILGFVPKDDQLAIISESRAVIQPTLFEGGPGGGAVYDAVSLSVPSIVSDIPVNREIDIGDVRFFRAGSSEDLAEKMIHILVNPPEMINEEKTAGQLAARQRRLGRLLLDIANIAARPYASQHRS